MNTYVDKMTLSKMTIEETFVDKMTVNKMTTDENI
jgi:hypothetical protein